MKIFCVFLSILAIILMQTACGPAAENRDAMQARAKVVADSIAESIRSRMAEADAPGPMGNVIKIDTPSTHTATPK